MMFSSGGGVSHTTPSSSKSGVTYDFEQKFKTLFEFRSVATLTTEERRREAQKGFGRIDFRHGSKVCLHWLKKLCLKGEKCEFLHRLDIDRLPECPQKMDCTVEGCELPHEDPQERNLCRFYEEGFCPYGPLCKMTHRIRDGSRLPERVDFEAKLQKKVAQTANDSTAPNANYRTRLCQNFERDGLCKYGDACHYAHGRDQLRVPNRTPAMGMMHGSHPSSFPNFQGRISPTPARPYEMPGSKSRTLKDEFSMVRGYLFAYERSDIVDECLRTGFLGLTGYEIHQAQFINSACPIFVMDVQRSEVRGIFEACGAPEQSRGMSSPYPFQIRFRSLLEVAHITTGEMKQALRAVDPSSALRSRPLSVLVVTALINFFVSRWKSSSRTLCQLATIIPIGTAAEYEKIIPLLKERFDRCCELAGRTQSGDLKVALKVQESDDKRSSHAWEVLVQSGDADAFIIVQRKLQEAIARTRISLRITPPLIFLPPSPMATM